MRSGLCGTIQESCLERTILFGEASLRRSVREFLSHYRCERNHQGLDNRLIIPIPVTLLIVGRFAGEMGGMLNYYFRQAA